MSTGVIDFVSQLFRTREEKSARNSNAWHQLIVGVATGKEKNPEETLAELERLGKTPEQLQAALKEYQRRVVCAAELAAVPEIEAEIKKIDKEYSAAEAALQAAEEKYRPIMNAAAYRHRDLDRKLSDAITARGDLLRTGYDPNVEARIAAIQAQIPVVERRLADLKHEHDQKGRRLLQAKDKLPGGSYDENQAIKKEIDELTALYEEERQAIADLEAQHKTLYAQIEKEREAYLDPACVDVR